MVQLLEFLKSTHMPSKWPDSTRNQVKLGNAGVGFYFARVPTYDQLVSEYSLRSSSGEDDAEEGNEIDVDRFHAHQKERANRERRYVYKHIESIFSRWVDTIPLHTFRSILLNCSLNWMLKMEYKRQNIKVRLSRRGHRVSRLLETNSDNGAKYDAMNISGMMKSNQSNDWANRQGRPHNMLINWILWFGEESFKVQWSVFVSAEPFYFTFFFSVIQSFTEINLTLLFHFSFFICIFFVWRIYIQHKKTDKFRCLELMTNYWNSFKEKKCNQVYSYRSNLSISLNFFDIGQIFISISFTYFYLNRVPFRFVSIGILYDFSLLSKYERCNQIMHSYIQFTKDYLHQ